MRIYIVRVLVVRYEHLKIPYLRITQSEHYIIEAKEIPSCTFRIDCNLNPTVDDFCSQSNVFFFQHCHGNK